MSTEYTPLERDLEPTIPSYLPFDDLALISPRLTCWRP